MLVIVLIVVLMIGVGDKVDYCVGSGVGNVDGGAGDVGVVDGSLVTATVNVLLSVLHRCVVSSVITRLWCFK